MGNIKPAAMIITGRRLAAGVTPLLPELTNAESISSRSCRADWCLQRADHSVVPGGAERAEERHVSLIEALSAGELSATAIDGPVAAGGHRRPCWCTGRRRNGGPAAFPKRSSSPHQADDHTSASYRRRLPALLLLGRRRGKRTRIAHVVPGGLDPAVGALDVRDAELVDMTVEGVGDAADVPPDAKRKRHTNGRTYHVVVDECHLGIQDIRELGQEIKRRSEVSRAEGKNSATA